MEWNEGVVTCMLGEVVVSSTSNDMIGVWEEEDKDEGAGYMLGEFVGSFTLSDVCDVYDVM